MSPGWRPKATGLQAGCWASRPRAPAPRLLPTGQWGRGPQEADATDDSRRITHIPGNRQRGQNGTPEWDCPEVGGTVTRAEPAPPGASTPAARVTAVPLGVGSWARHASSFQRHFFRKNDSGLKHVFKKREQKRSLLTKTDHIRPTGPRAAAGENRSAFLAKSRGDASAHSPQYDWEIRCCPSLQKI